MWSKPINRASFPDYIYQVINHSSEEKHCLLCFEMKIVKTALWQTHEITYRYTLFNLCILMTSIINCTLMDTLRNVLKLIDSLSSCNNHVWMCVAVLLTCPVSCCRCSSKPPPWRCPWAWAPLCPLACSTSPRYMSSSSTQSRMSRSESAASKLWCRRPPCPRTCPRSPMTNKTESPRLSRTDHSEMTQNVSSR